MVHRAPDDPSVRPSVAAVRCRTRARASPGGVRQARQDAVKSLPRPSRACRRSAEAMTIRALTVEPGLAGSAALDDIADPEPAPDELLVDARLVGVCGTDREILGG